MYKVIQKIQPHLVTGLLFLVILVGIILGSCKFGTKESDNFTGNHNNGKNSKTQEELINLELIEKNCNSDYVFIQSEINEIDTITILNFKLSSSFYSKDSSMFEIVISNHIEHVKDIIYPHITICKDGTKTIGRSALYNNSYIPKQCDFFYTIDDSSYVFNFTNNSNTILCFRRPPNMSDF